MKRVSPPGSNATPSHKKAISRFLHSQRPQNPDIKKNSSNNFWTGEGISTVWPTEEIHLTSEWWIVKTEGVLRRFLKVIRYRCK